MRNLRRFAAVTVATLCLLPVIPVAAQDINEDFAVDPGQRLNLSLERMGGRLEIAGWEQNRVHIEGRIRGHGRQSDAVLDIDHSRSGIDVIPGVGYDDDWDVEATLRIKVPHQFDLRIRASTRTLIADVEGDIQLSIANENVELDNLTGECRIATANGKLDVDNCSLEGEISNTNGRLRINGSDVSGEVSSTNSNMSISRAPKGIDVESTNGNIEVDSAADHVLAQTTNGNVTIGELDGWIDAETVNGNVRVRMIGDPDGKRTVDIKTLNGDVEIEIPEGFSMDFDVEVKRRGSNRERFEIFSDFDLDIQTSDSRRDRYRSHGKGSISGGRNRVRIRATNGDVYLRQAS